MAKNQHLTNMNLVLAELLPQILDNCTTSELLKLRLVNTEWKKVATFILLNKGNLKIEFQLSPTSLKCKTKSGITFYAFKPDEELRDLCPKHRQDLDNNIVRSMSMLKLCDRKRALTNFFKLLVTSPPTTSSLYSLPVRHFAFHLDVWSKPDKIQPQLLSFVQTFGPSLRALTLDSFVHYFVGCPGMPNFVLQYTPNLESLHIYNKHGKSASDLTHNDPKMGGRIYPKFTLPRLKTVEINQTFWSAGTREILSYLLEISPNLRKVYFPILVPKEILQFFPPSKLTLLHIETLELSGQDLFSNGLDNLENLVRMMTTMARDPDRPQGINLKGLVIDGENWPSSRGTWNRVATALCQIFLLNQKSLKKIELRRCTALILHKIPGLPTLPKVTHLSLEIWPKTGNVPDFTPCKNSLSALFPNVDQVDLSLSWIRNLDDYDQGNVFPFWGEELRQVKIYKVGFKEFIGDVGINIFEDGTNHYMEMLKMCPDATRLSAEMVHLSNLPVVLQSLWNVNLNLLTDLHLESIYWGDIAFNALYLDAAFTGLSVESALAIYNNWLEFGLWDWPRGWPQDQTQRNGPSLLNLTSLKKLKFDFELAVNVEPMLLISGVSAQFAFDLMLNLQVDVVFTTCARWPDCLLRISQHGPGKKEKFLELHQPLLSFPRIKLTVVEE